jgi:hypothetical protein
MAKGKKGQLTPGSLFAVGLGLMLCFLFIFGGPGQWIYETYGPDWMREKPSDVEEDAEQVDLSIKCQFVLGRDVPGSALPVDIYDSNKIFVETASTDTTTGVASFQDAFWEGETVFVQAYVQPNSASAQAYCTALTEMTVPEADVNGDAQLSTLNIREPTGSAATFSVTDQGSNAISGTAINYINASSDASLRVTVVCTSTDSVFGTPEAFHDWRTDYDYLAGGWVVLTSNITQDMQGYEYYFEEGSTFYYVYAFAMLINDADDYADGAITLVLATGSTFSANDAAITIDIYDTLRLNSAGGVDSNSFKDYNSSNNPSVITTRVR